MPQLLQPGVLPDQLLREEVDGHRDEQHHDGQDDEVRPAGRLPRQLPRADDRQPEDRRGAERPEPQHVQREGVGQPDDGEDEEERGGRHLAADGVVAERERHEVEHRQHGDPVGVDPLPGHDRRDDRDERGDGRAGDEAGLGDGGEIADARHDPEHGEAEDEGELRVQRLREGHAAEGGLDAAGRSATDGGGSLLAHVTPRLRSSPGRSSILTASGASAPASRTP
ncbi:hypothetical protein [Clavibacter zhangzhiyongii]|uniref:hypothetical protein n=1 Tax=Clavibacter zhangzhiyongii TaxID=2768071 RepID=UPI0039E1AE90